MKIWTDNIENLWVLYLSEDTNPDKNEMHKYKESLARALKTPLDFWLRGHIRSKRKWYNIEKVGLSISQLTNQASNDVISEILRLKPKMDKPDAYIYTMVTRQIISTINQFKLDFELLEVNDSNAPEIYQEDFYHKTVQEIDKYKKKSIVNILKNKVSNPLNDYEIEVFVQRYLSYDTDFKEWHDVATDLKRSEESVKSAHKMIKKKLLRDRSNYNAILKTLKSYA